MRDAGSSSSSMGSVVPIHCPSARLGYIIFDDRITGEEFVNKMTPQTQVTRTIIGLEIHVQLLTNTKMFCGCPVKVDAPPNTCVCPVCLGHPGALPVINRRAFELGVLAGMALDCRIARHTKWDRKSYYYPDMPKNYQISQYDLPICSDGKLDIDLDGQKKTIRIQRAHLEEDAGKSTHDPSGCTLVDLNRAGTPLLEIVTEPDLCSGQEAFVFCTELWKLITYLEVSEGVMKKGQMRFEPNVNIAIEEGGREYRTPIVEIKNLNSFRSVKSAIEYEADRQIAAWREDHDYVLGTAPNENRGFNDDKGITEFQRLKEGADDYRYFPDPDLAPVELSDAMVDEIRSSLPELPTARRRRFETELKISVKNAETLVAHRETADLFELAITNGGPVDTLCNQFVNVWLKLAHDRGVNIVDLGIGVDRMAMLARMASDGTVNKTSANTLAAVMLERSEPPDDLAKELGLIQVRDTGATEAWVEEALAANKEAVADALDNPKKTPKAIGFLRGQVMKLSQGKADPVLVGKIIERTLEEMKRR